ncbi:MAG: hypothetical protein ABI478_12935, partial [Propionivibrio sp.]
AMAAAAVGHDLPGIAGYGLSVAIQAHALFLEPAERPSGSPTPQSLDRRILEMTEKKDRTTGG